VRTASSEWVSQHQNILLLGPTGIGKLGWHAPWHRDQILPADPARCIFRPLVGTVAYPRSKHCRAESKIFTLALLWVALSACASARAETGSAACAACHSNIYKSYMRTPMAVSSGRVGAGGFQEKFDQNEFGHALSGVRYRVYRDGNNSLFDFDFADGEARFKGSRRLEYFIGSGTVGRSYLLSADNFLYQAPVAYYSAQRRWELSPGYELRDHLYLTRPVGVTCLLCHASRLQPTAGTLNGFAPVPFLEGGIGCETCHGPGEEHIRITKTGAVGGGIGIVNPRKLPPDRRDSVCEQCHLTGVARVDKAGKEPGSFRPGGRLSDSVSVFVWSGATAEMTVNSHFEKLAQSRCKIESGERLWCGSCHDPHSLPAEAEKAAYFRQKCVTCHASNAGCKASPAVRARNGDNCIECHMPKNPVTDVAHAVYTDHSIPRRKAGPALKATPTNGALQSFWSGPASSRDLGLGYALILASGRNAVYEARAFELLKDAVDRQPDDIPALVQLANMYGYRSEEDRAIALYEKAVRADPAQLVAANNLATYLMNRGGAEEAIRLWSGALAQSPGFEVASMNLAVAQFRAGDSKSAQATLTKALELNPGSTAARKLLNEFRGKAP